ncbi:MAG TPA: DUF1553 domain-containing protein [Kiritimatiellia bacterium]|nr:DUF1553 domain-containing protein [Kiritimatiellia bacterium]
MWRIVCLIVAVRAGFGAPAPEAALFLQTGTPTPENPVDAPIFRKLKRHGITPVYCTDAVFLRRAYLDILGTLPTADEARAFLADTSMHKRTALIDRLLERDEFADYWAMRWSDLLRVKAEFPVNLWPNAAQAYHRWIRTAMRDNKPYDCFARELLLSNGSNFRVGPVNFYRATPDRSPEGLASAVALTLMGARTEHWPSNTLADLAVFFSQVRYKPTREWKEEIVFWDPEQPLTTTAGRLPDGTSVRLEPGRDPRTAFAEWLITPQNPWFTRALVNRVWYWLLGRGIIHEPDDIRSDNPPSHPDLLKRLQREFVRSGYDLRKLYRLILTSRTYQFSPVFPSGRVESAAPLFAYYPLRQLDAEVLIDAINKVTGTSDLYTSAIPEPFTFIPANKPAVALPDGSITSPFLELFGRPARATGLASERINRALPPQRMHLLNSSHIQRKLETSPVLRRMFRGKRGSRAMIEEAYLTTLSRFPSATEIGTVERYLRSGVVKEDAAGVDLIWALINSDEFLYRH